MPVITPHAMRHAEVNGTSGADRHRLHGLDDDALGERRRRREVVGRFAAEGERLSRCCRSTAGTGSGSPRRTRGSDRSSRGSRRRRGRRARRRAPRAPTSSTTPGALVAADDRRRDRGSCRRAPRGRCGRRPAATSRTVTSVGPGPRTSQVVGDDDLAAPEMDDPSHRPDRSPAPGPGAVPRPIDHSRSPRNRGAVFPGILVGGNGLVRGGIRGPGDDRATAEERCDARRGTAESARRGRGLRGLPRRARHHRDDRGLGLPQRRPALDDQRRRLAGRCSGSRWPSPSRSSSSIALVGVRALQRPLFELSRAANQLQVERLPMALRDIEAGAEPAPRPGISAPPELEGVAGALENLERFVHYHAKRAQRADRDLGRLLTGAADRVGARARLAEGIDLVTEVTMTRRRSRSRARRSRRSHRDCTATKVHCARSFPIPRPRRPPMPRRRTCPVRRCRTCRPRPRRRRCDPRPSAIGELEPAIVDETASDAVVGRARRGDRRRDRRRQPTSSCGGSVQPEGYHFVVDARRSGRGRDELAQVAEALRDRDPGHLPFGLRVAVQAGRRARLLVWLTVADAHAQWHVLVPPDAVLAAVADGRVRARAPPADRAAAIDATPVVASRNGRRCRARRSTCRSESWAEPVPAPRRGDARGSRRRRNRWSARAGERHRGPRRPGADCRRRPPRRRAHQPLRPPRDRARTPRARRSRPRRRGAHRAARRRHPPRRQAPAGAAVLVAVPARAVARRSTSPSAPSGRSRSRAVPGAGMRSRTRRSREIRAKLGDGPVGEGPAR